MKKVILILCLALPALMPASAALRTESEALRLAEQFVASKHTFSAMPAHSLKLAKTYIMPQLQQPAMYVFNAQEAFVIVSAVEEDEPILAYSNESAFELNNMPDHIRMWMNRYAAEAQWLEQHPEYAPKGMDKSYEPVDAICRARWNQAVPYNDLCPYDGGGHCLTGCVATAAAIVMYAHKYPATGMGSHSYMWLPNGETQTETLSADFGATTYQWDKMSDAMYSSDEDDERNAIATLMYHCGVSADMAYGSDGSGTQSEFMYRSLYTYFRYDKAIRVLGLDYNRDTSLLNYVHYELLQGRPMLMSGATKSQEGHAFVLDGMDEEGKVHINWGWGGMSNGMFTIRCLDPESQGAGGAASGEAFTERVKIACGIRPEQGGMRVPSLGVDVLKAKLDAGDIEFSSSNVTNLSPDEWTGRYGILVYREGVLVRVMNEGNKTSIPVQETGANIGKFYFWQEDFDLPDGQYRITIGARYEDADTWYPLLVRGQGEKKWDLIVEDGDISIVENLQDDPISEPVHMALGSVWSDEHMQSAKVMRDGRILIRQGDYLFDLLGNRVEE